MKRMILLIGLIFALASQVFSAQASVVGSVVGVSRKTNSTFFCGGTPSASFIWVNIKRSDNGTKAWYIYDAGEIGREVMAVALTALTTGTPVRVYYNDAGYSECSGTYKLEELWISSDGL